MKKDHKKQTAAQRVFSTYTIYISNMVIDKFGGSYTTLGTIHNTWRREFPYSKEIENFLIFNTKMYIRFLDSRDSNSTNPQFLEALAREIADYLSAYTVRNPKHANRKKAKEVLKIELYDESSYIQNLLARQAVARDARDSSRRHTYKRPNDPKKKKQMQDAQSKFNNARNQQNSKIIEIVVKKR